MTRFELVEDRILMTVTIPIQICTTGFIPTAVSKQPTAALKEPALPKDEPLQFSEPEELVGGSNRNGDGVVYHSLHGRPSRVCQRRSRLQGESSHRGRP